MTHLENGLPESMCLAHNCHLKEKCERFTRKKSPRGDAFQNFSPFKKGELKGKCLYFKDNGNNHEKLDI